MKTFHYLNQVQILFLVCLTITSNIFCIDISILLEKYDKNEENINLIFYNITKIYDLEDEDAFFRIKNTNNISKEQENEQKCVLSYIQNNWYLGKKKLKIKAIGLVNETKNNCIDYQNFSYQGIIKIHIDEKYIYITNTVDLEKYVAAVVAKEFYTVWHFNSLKIAAIIARTYAMHKIFQTKEKNKFFHIKSSIFDQYYCGYIHNDKIEAAVQETFNKIITWQNKPIIAMYHVCCGGVIPKECVGFNFEKFPYLKRTKQCIGCKSYKRYEWQIYRSHELICDQLSEFLNKKIIKIKKILKVTYGKSGSVKKLLLEIDILKNKKTKQTIQVSLSNRQLRKILNLQLNAHSAFFKLHFDNNHNLEIIGKGNGHHMGLCQIGMHEYIKKGLSIDEVIKFYYPETKILSLNQIDF